MFLRVMLHCLCYIGVYFKCLYCVCVMVCACGHFVLHMLVGILFKLCCASVPNVFFFCFSLSVLLYLHLRVVCVCIYIYIYVCVFVLLLCVCACVCMCCLNYLRWSCINCGYVTLCAVLLTIV